jgi:hypothetical protein
MRSSKVPEHPPAGSCTSHSRECARAARRLTSVAARTFLRDDLQLGRLVTCATVRDCRQQLVDALKALIELRHLLRVRPGQQRLSNGAWGPRGYCRSAVNVGNQELHPNARPSRGVDCRYCASWLHSAGAGAAAGPSGRQAGFRDQPLLGSESESRGVVQPCPSPQWLALTPAKPSGAPAHSRARRPRLS